MYYSLLFAVTVMLAFVLTGAMRITIPTPADNYEGWRRTGFIVFLVIASLLTSFIGESIADMNGAIIGGLLGVVLVYVAGITHFLRWLINLIPERVRNVVSMVVRIIGVVILAIAFVLVGYIVIHWWFSI